MYYEANDPNTPDRQTMCNLSNPAQFLKMSPQKILDCIQ